MKARGTPRTAYTRGRETGNVGGNADFTPSHDSGQGRSFLFPWNVSLPLIVRLKINHFIIDFGGSLSNYSGKVFPEGRNRHLRALHAACVSCLNIRVQTLLTGLRSNKND